MKRIFKYKLDKQFLTIKSDSILSVEEQHGDIVVYAMIDDEKELSTFEFKVIGTGHQIDFNTDEYKFLDTVKLMNGDLMFHVFYKIIDTLASI